MRKYYLLIILLLITGCSINKFSFDDKIDINNSNGEFSKYEDTSSITIGIYVNRKLQTEYVTNGQIGKDVGLFSIALTHDAKLSNNIKYSYLNLSKKFDNINDYRFGYYLSFYNNDEFNELTILDVDAKYKIQPFTVFLYDDVHQKDGAFYSHVTEKKADTLFTSIKLYANNTLSGIRDIELTAFAYRPIDINENGYYRGNNKYTIKIKI